MNHRSFGFIISLFSLLAAGSCHTSLLTLSVLQPADTVLPASIESISVIPMAGVNSPAKTDSQNILFPLNSYSVKMGYIEGIYDIFSASPRFSRVVLTDTNIAWFFHEKEINWEELQQVCKHDTTNTILLLSKATSFESQSIDALYSENYMFYVINQTRWLFLNPETQQTMARFTFTDTLLVPSGYFFNGQAFYKDQLCHHINFVTGETCGKRLAPSWIEVNRVIYKGPGRDLRDASVLAEKNKWRNAGLLWNDLVTYKKIRIASRAAFNLALAFEREDDLDQAWLWVTYADSLKHTRLSSEYGKVLQNRIEQSAELNRQMSGN